MGERQHNETYTKRETESESSKQRVRKREIFEEIGVDMGGELTLASLVSLEEEPLARASLLPETWGDKPHPGSIQHTGHRAAGVLRTTSSILMLYPKQQGSVYFREQRKSAFSLTCSLGSIAQHVAPYAFQRCYR